MLELLVTLAIVSIVLGLSVTDVGSLLRGSRTAALAADLASLARLARSESVKRALPVTLCASTDGENCAHSTDWSVGWLLVDDDGEPIAVRDAVSTRFTIDASAPAARFLDTGFQAGAALSIDITDDACGEAEMARRVGIDRTGHVHVEPLACS